MRTTRLVTVGIILASVCIIVVLLKSTTTFFGIRIGFWGSAVCLFCWLVVVRASGVARRSSRQYQSEWYHVLGMWFQLVFWALLPLSLWQHVSGFRGTSAFIPLAVITGIMSASGLYAGYTVILILEETITGLFRVMRWPDR
jgi:hypothetical protein